MPLSNLKLELRPLRAIIRKNSKSIIDQIIVENKKTICTFCGSVKDTSREHVIPRWIFENNTTRFFTTDINGLNQTYNRTTIPACHSCNTNLLNSLEKYIKELFEKIDKSSLSFSEVKTQNIISWLEVIDYKFQILNIRREFRASKQHGYIPYLSNLPLSVLRPSINYSPFKAFTEIRRSQKRITIKAKNKNKNSFVIFKTSNPDFYFFHHMDAFIFLELPKYKFALFYFYKKIFRDNEAAYNDAKSLIHSVYNS